ncbi:hypothetical protein Q666_09555 [Marinobacter sp. ES-1]|nr:hypothetical protein Q666_09555 [Marinobacter sp. ES-1]
MRITNHFVVYITTIRALMFSHLKHLSNDIIVFVLVAPDAHPLSGARQRLFFCNVNKVNDVYKF